MSRWLVVSVVIAWAAPAVAATLPWHQALKVIVIGDEVNPNGLSDAELTQPADIPAALNAADSGLHLTDGGATLVDSQCIDDALTALASTAPPDVVIYFAHLPAQACGGGDRQPELTAAFERFLQARGGIVVFHHGMFAAAGKDPILQLLGARATSIDWNTVAGQRVFDVAPGHFITTNGTRFDGGGPLIGAGPVRSGTYPYFDNKPDERYPATELLFAPGEQREILFASDSGGTRVLGYTLVRPGWTGRVVWYQPAEYQPRALDDRGGVNFQILANAILYAAQREFGGPTLNDDYFPSDDGTTGGGGGCCDASRHDAPWGPLAIVAIGLAWRSRRRTARAGRSS
jgi:hypothetical protein